MNIIRKKKPLYPLCNADEAYIVATDVVWNRGSQFLTQEARSIFSQFNGTLPAVSVSTEKNGLHLN